MKFWRRVSRISPPTAAAAVGDFTHLDAVHQAQAHRKADVKAAAILLLVDTHVVAFVVRQRQLGQAFELEWPRRCFDQLAKGIDAIVVDHELEPRLDPRDAVFGGQIARYR